MASCGGVCVVPSRFITACPPVAGSLFHISVHSAVQIARPASRITRHAKSKHTRTDTDTGNRCGPYRGVRTADKVGQKVCCHSKEICGFTQRRPNLDIPNKAGPRPPSPFRLALRCTRIHTFACSLRKWGFPSKSSSCDQKKEDCGG